MLCLPSVHAQPVEMIHRWEIDPQLGSQWVFDFWAQPRAVDVAALRSSKLQTQVKGAQTASLQSRAGVTNRQEVFATALEQLRSPQPNHQARLAMVSAALNVADNKQEVESVWRAVAADPITRKVVEPQLIKWKSELAIDLWRERLAQGESGLGAFRYSDLLNALDGLAVVGTGGDQAGLETLLLKNGTALPIQLAASQALGAVVPKDLERLAEQILASEKPQHCLLAANLLASHSGQAAEDLLERILDQPNSPAQIVAYRALTRANKSRARRFADEFIEHSDNNLRLAAVNVLDQFEDAASLNVQALGIDDLNPDIRNLVRANLERKAASAELRPLIDEIISFHLQGDRWQGTEQAITLAVALNELERIPNFLTLLDHPEPFVFIRAAWALQELELTNESLANILDRCRPVTQKLADKEFVPFEDVVKTAFLFEAIGRHAYQPADELLRIYVPKDGYKMIGLTRAAAVYALGYIWQDSGNLQLAEQLAERMLDEDPFVPEDDLVQYTAAVALGRIKHPSSIAELQKISVAPGIPLSDAASWALDKLQAGK